MPRPVELADPHPASVLRRRRAGYATRACCYTGHMTFGERLSAICAHLNERKRDVLVALLDGGQALARGCVALAEVPL